MLETAVRPNVDFVQQPALLNTGIRSVIARLEARRKLLAINIQENEERLLNEWDPSGRNRLIVGKEADFFLEAATFLPSLQESSTAPFQYLILCDLGVLLLEESIHFPDAFQEEIIHHYSMREIGRRAAFKNRGFTFWPDSFWGYPNRRLLTALIWQNTGVLPPDFLLNCQGAEPLLEELGYKDLSSFKRASEIVADFHSRVHRVGFGGVLRRELARDSSKIFNFPIGLWSSPWDRFSGWDEFYQQYGVNPEVDGWEQEEKSDPNLRKVLNQENLPRECVVAYLGIGSGRNLSMVQETLHSTQIVVADYSDAVLEDTRQKITRNQLPINISLEKVDFYDFHALENLVQQHQPRLVIDWLTLTNLSKISLLANLAYAQRQLAEGSYWIGSYYSSDHPWVRATKVFPEILREKIAYQWVAPDDLYLSAYRPKELRRIFELCGFTVEQLYPYKEQEGETVHDYIAVVVKR